MINMAKRYVWQSVFAWSMFAFAWPVAAQPNEFSFGVIAHPFKASSDESILRDAISKTDADNLAFVVASGMKSATEPCTDALYKRRKDILNSAKNGLIVSLAGNDWSDCKNTHGKSSAMERLNRLRDLFCGNRVQRNFAAIQKTRAGRSAMSCSRRSICPRITTTIGRRLDAIVNLRIG
jgi:hypothetical protein